MFKLYITVELTRKQIWNYFFN